MNITREVRDVFYHFGIGDLLFLSDTFNHNEDWVLELCSELKALPFRVRWSCNARVDRFTDSMAEAMRTAGCELISFGIESGSQKVLDEAGKGTRLKEAELAVAAARKAGIRSLTYFMFGLPGERADTIEETIRFANRVGADYAHFYSATPFPGTRFFKLAGDKGWLTSWDWTRYYHGISDVIAYPDLTAEEIRSAVRRAYRSFYLRPSILFREVVSIRSWQRARGSFGAALKLLRRSILSRR